MEHKRHKPKNYNNTNSKTDRQKKTRNKQRIIIITENSKQETTKHAKQQTVKHNRMQTKNKTKQKQHTEPI